VLPETPSKTSSAVASIAERVVKPVQDRFASAALQADTVAVPVRSTKTAEATAPSSIAAIAGK
jgi:hypothetical protein